ncbi:MAG: hypothetical protein PHO37_13440, partial [Kiritimatiellae bacterium]|nr:hypothetical protein [Kiritimatiellia bacterium]
VSHGWRVRYTLAACISPRCRFAGAVTARRRTSSSRKLRSFKSFDCLRLPSTASTASTMFGAVTACTRPQGAAC